MLQYDEIKEKPRELPATTGLRLDEFECLLPAVEICYKLSLTAKPKPTKKKKQRAGGGGRQGKLPKISDKLFFIPVYQKTFQLQVMHGLQFGLSQTRVGFQGYEPEGVLNQQPEKR